LAKDKDKPARESASAPLGWRALKGLLVVLGVVAAGCGVVWGLSELRDSIRVSPGYQMTSESLSLVTYPPWMTEAIRDELDIQRLDPSFPKRFSLLDDDVCDRIAAAYSRCVWVERVERIVKHDPRVDPSRPPLEVDLKFRHPTAFIQVEDGYALVDSHGIRLPGLYREPSLGDNPLIVIAGAPWLAPQPGAMWDDPSVQAGLKVAVAVETKREAFCLETIDVSNVGYRRNKRDSEIALHTTNGTCIKWGKAPTPEAELLQEKTCAEKVAYLDYVYKSLGGRVDGIMEYVDIPNEVYRRWSTDLATRVRS
jgi:hypothetical protein